MPQTHSRGWQNDLTIVIHCRTQKSSICNSSEFTDQSYLKETSQVQSQTKASSVLKAKEPQLLWRRENSQLDMQDDPRCERARVSDSEEKGRGKKLARVRAHAQATGFHAGCSTQAETPPLIPISKNNKYSGNPDPYVHADPFPSVCKKTIT